MSEVYHSFDIWAKDHVGGVELVKTTDKLSRRLDQEAFASQRCQKSYRALNTEYCYSCRWGFGSSFNLIYTCKGCNELYHLKVAPYTVSGSFNAISLAKVSRESSKWSYTSLLITFLIFNGISIRTKCWSHET